MTLLGPVLVPPVLKPMPQEMKSKRFLNREGRMRNLESTNRGKNKNS